MPNRLAATLSPYLQQHKDNPVEWYPWGDEALERSRRENKPIFLSIGYSSCHWCHVMERETFSDPTVAEILSRHFISIKVDREERPDLDHIYMTALQMMTGQGGWPLNIFLTTDLRPFFGGTYFAPDSRYGKPPFKELLEKIAGVYSTQQDLVRKNADQLVGLLAQQGQFFQTHEKNDGKLREAVLTNLRKSYDPVGGGLGAAPKFFHTDGLRVMLREAKLRKDTELLRMVEHSLTQMALGGVYDHVGGGFHRYSTDALWQIPHFEKMLYDNALLAVLYLEAFAETKNLFYRDIVTETLDWVLREMTPEEGGGFYSAIDADSEHHEGKFYIWSQEEVQVAVPGELRVRFMERYEVSERGNFERQNILHLKTPLSPEERKLYRPGLEKLLTMRNKRVWPLVDRKILTSWNGLMISAMAKAGHVLQEPKYVEAARAAADEILKVAFRDSKLSHVSFRNAASREGFLEDYAYFAEGLLDLFEVKCESKYLESAKELAELMLSEFYDSENAGFWATRGQTADVLLRYKEIFDGAVPAAFHLALSVLQRLHAYTGDKKWKEPFEKSVCSILGTALESPGGFHRLAWVVDREVPAPSCSA